MATWEEFKDYVRSRFEVEVDDDSLMTLRFDTPHHRTHQVALAHEPLDEDWVVMFSPVGDVGEVDLVAATACASNVVCGGIAADENVVVLKHAIPLANLDANEFEAPLALIVNTADEMERHLTGRDDY